MANYMRSNMVRMCYSHCIFVVYAIVFSFTTKAVISYQWLPNVHIRMLTASIRVVFQNREAVVNQDGNFNVKKNFHFVLLIIDDHCTLFTILLHKSIPESNQIIRIEKFESKYFNRTSL